MQAQLCFGSASPSRFGSAWCGREKRNHVMPDAKFTGEELVIALSEQANAQLQADPDLAKDMQGIFALFRQAQQSFHDGHHASFEAALAALGVEAKLVSEDDES
jgi:hypothetical protein